MASGSDWERESARVLSEWLTGKRDPPVLWRSVASGGWQHAGVPDVGDLRPRLPDGREEGVEFRKRFSVECKSYKNEPQLWPLFSGSNPKLLQWWEQAVGDCEDYDYLCPLVLANRSYYPNIVCLPDDFSLPAEGTAEKLHLPRSGIQVILMEEWLSYTPDDVYACWEAWESGR